MATAVRSIPFANREEWLQIRKRGLGGSDAAAALGLSRWKSPLRLYLEKIGEIEDEVDSEAAYWGTVLEDVVVKEFEKRTGKRTRRINRILQHPDYSWMLANIDRQIIGESAILEVKTTSAWNAKEWVEDEIPQEYVIQVMHYLAVTGAQKAYIAALIGGNRLVIKEIERDEEMIGAIIAGEREFWHHVETRTPPELDGSEDAAKILQILYPRHEEGKRIEIPEAKQLVEDLVALKAQIKDLEEMAREKENKIKELMGDAEVALIGDYKVTWKTIKTKRLNTKKLKAEQPELYEQYSEEKEYRRFLIKTGGEQNGEGK